MTIDYAQLREITANDTPLMNDLLGVLLRNAAERIDELRHALAAQDTKQCEHLAHGLRGACELLGACAMGTALLNIEWDAAAGDLRRCESSLDLLALNVESLRFEAATLLTHFENVTCP